MENGRNHTIDCLKGIAILFIVITHFDNIPNREINSLRFLFPFWLSMAVPIFMVLSGFVNAKSLSRKEIGSIREAYSFNYIVKKLIRFVIPFVFIFAIEQILVVLGGGTPSFKKIVVSFFTGGNGKGSYYIPILIQFVFIFPTVYLLVRERKQRGVVLCAIINLLFDVLQSVLGLDESIYRLLIFRYLFVIALGCYAGIKEKINKKSGMIMSLVGIAYIILVKYAGINPFFTKSWSGTSMLACMYIAPLIILTVNECDWHIRIFEEMGKASYNIFLVQMLYYYSFARFVYSAVDSVAMQFLISLGFCIIAGWLYYKAETPLTKKLVVRITKKNMPNRMDDVH